MGVQPPLRRPSPRPDAAADRPDRTAAVDAGHGRSTVATDVRTGQQPIDEPPAVEQAAIEATPAGEPVAHRVRARSPRWLAGALILLIVLLAGASGWLIMRSSSSGTISERDQALSAAKSSVPLILSYNYKSFDADLAKAQVQLTGRARSDYVKAMTTTIKPAAAKADVVVQAQTDSAGVESVSADGNQVTVVVFGEQRVTNTALSSPRIDPFRVRATMDLVAGHWLVSKFDQI